MHGLRQCSVLVVLVAAAVARADNLYVPGTYGTIQGAINAAAAGDEVRISPGTYVETIDLLGKAITVRGSGGAEVTIIDGATGGTVISCISGEGPGTVIMDLTITNGIAEEGGGMLNLDSSPTLIGCVFHDNTAILAGGGMCNFNSNPLVTNCAFTENTCYMDGGGMFNGQGSSPTLIECLFSDNYGTTGGGVNNSQSSPSVDTCTFVNNEGNDGAGMHNDQSDPALANCLFTANLSTGTGGGLDNRDSGPTLTRCTFANNMAFASGGAIYNLASHPTLAHCRLGGNFTGAGGGGLANWQSDPVLINCLLDTNLSQYLGGGIYNREACNLTMINCTMSNNGLLSGWEGGAVAGLHNSDTCHTILVNCILWGGAMVEGPQVYNEAGGTVAATYSLIEGGWPGTGNVDGDPLFVNPIGLDDNLLNTEDNDCRIRGLSPAIDAGHNSAVPADTFDLDNDGNTAEPLPVDFENRSRFEDDSFIPDTGVGTPPIIDMGAYESRSDSCPWDVDGSRVVDPFDTIDIMAYFGCEVSDPGPDCDRRDLDGDGKVDPFDSNLAMGNFGGCP